MGGGQTPDSHCGERTLAQLKPASPRAPEDCLFGRLLTHSEIQQTHKHSEDKGSQGFQLQEMEGINTDRRKVRIDYVLLD